MDITDKGAKELNIEWFRSFHRCTMMSAFGSYLDCFKVEELHSFMRSIFEAVLKNCQSGANFEVSVEEKKDRKLLMRCLVNASNCSQK